MTIPTLDIQLSAPANIRDFGGIPVAGGTVREGFAIRADDLSTITSDVASSLVNNGLAAVIDLRTSHEVAITGRGPLAEHPVAYHHLPLIASVADSMSKDAPFMVHQEMGEMYADMVENAAPQLVTALNIIAHAPGATAFHCSAGRDRTGVLAAMLLLALGADDDDIVTDYARTGPNMAAIRERTKAVMGALFASLGIDSDQIRAATISDEPMEASMLLLLERLRERHQDALTPLRNAGLSESTIARLREKALIA